MDGKALLNAFSQTEQAELYAAMPNDALVAEVQRRGIEVPAAIGATATDGEVETSVVIQEIDAETAAKLEALPAGYRERVSGRYIEKYVAVDRYIRQGKLPEAYRLPELGVLIEQVEAVAPTFEHMQDKEWEPEVEFAPQGLSREQWNNLLSGTKPDGSEPLRGNWYGFSGKLIDPTDPAAKTGLWSVDVISAAERPIFTNVSKDGKHGRNAKETVKALAEMPGVSATDPADVIAQVSPSEATYNSLQLSLAERAEEQVDLQTWTISKENVKVDEALGSVFQGFNPGYRQVYSNWRYLDGAYGSSGVRPSASGQALVFELQTTA
jgi:hypothetical protein